MGYSDRLDRWTANVATVLVVFGGAFSVACLTAVVRAFV
jgi:hypothetical protein